MSAPTTSDLLKKIKSFTFLTPSQVVVMLGAAAAGVAAITNTYDVLFKVNDAVKECDQDAATNKLLKTRFIVFLVLSILAFISGILVGIFTKGNWKLTALGLSVAGLAGASYSLYSWFQYSTFSNIARISASWGLLAVFMTAGLLLSGSGLTASDAASVVELKEVKTN